MERRASEPRRNWRETVTSQGLVFHMTEDRPYWDESAFYCFTREQIDTIEKATYAINKMCLEAVEYVVQSDLFDLFQIPPPFVDFVKESWATEERTIYGRFDFAYDGENLKLLEYNADTPTALIEAAVIQWFWFQDVAGNDPAWDQFNAIHEQLIEAWRMLRDEARGILYFTSVPDYDEDFMTVSYLRDTAEQAGWKTEYIEIGEIGWNAGRGQFVDLQERPIQTIFKLYPWEWLVREPFGVHLKRKTARWLEAPWKMLLSNKAILPILYRLYPDSPYLLASDFEPLSGSYVRKPILGREGANTTIVHEGAVLTETGGLYSGPYIYQKYYELPEFAGRFPILGSWFINGWACGLGIREDTTRITGNRCRFVPHLFRS